MKKILFFALSALLCVSCTLYMDEEPDVNNDDELPVYTGEGYDDVIHVQDDQLDAYYQYQSNVRHFTDEMQRHIVRVKSDPDELFTYIDFDKDTPAELLPVKGDILVSLETDRFPEGIGNHVLAIGDIGQYYRCLTCVADMNDIFKTLKLNAAVPNPDASGAALTRADDENIDLDKGHTFHHTFHPDGTFSLSKGAVEGKVIFEEKRNTIDQTFNIQVEMVEGMIPRVTLYENAKFNLDFDVVGTLQGEKKIKENKNLLPPKAQIKLGYVLIKFVLGYKLMLIANGSITGNISGTTDFEFSLTTPKVDVSKNISAIAELKDFGSVANHFDNDYDFSKIVIGGFIGFRLQLSVGVGLYTKSIGLRYQPYISMGFKSSFGGTNSAGIIDISLSNALEFTPNVGHEAVIMIDLNLEKIASSVLGSFINDAASLVELTEYLTGSQWDEGSSLKEFSEQWNKYTEYLDEDGTLKDEHHQTLLDKLKGPWAISFSLGEKTIEKFHWTKSWYPKINDDKLRISRVTLRNDDGTADFQGSFRIADPGVYASHGDKFYPQIALYKGSELIGTYRPQATTPITKSTSPTKDFVFEFKGLKYEDDYVAHPCYSDKLDGDIKWFDKGLPFSAGTPLFNLNYASQDNCSYSHMSASTSPDGKEHDGYIFEFSSIATLDGARTHKINKMGIDVTWKDDSGNSQTTSQEWPYTVQGITYGIKDGSYTNGWRITTIDQPSVDVTLTPWVDVTDKETGVKTHIKFSPYKLELAYTD